MPPPKDIHHVLRGPGDYEVTSQVHNDTYPAIDPRQADLSGKAVFVTGGSRGLGRAMVLAYARAGASRIGVGARSDLSSLEADVTAAAQAAGRSPPTFLAVKLDVTDVASVAAAAATVSDVFDKKLDILVNNAGVLGHFSLIADTKPDEWWNILDVNLKGPYLVTRAFVPLLLSESPESSSESSNKLPCKYIVNVSSVAAFLENPTVSAYQVSKAALLKLSVLTQAEYAPRGVTTFTVHPGNSPTDIVGGVDGVGPDLKHVFVETPELSADSIVYLTREPRPWLGGRYINCTWDMPELVTKKDVIVERNLLKAKFDYAM